MKSKEFPYSLSYTLATIVVMLVLMLMLFTNVKGSNSTWAWAIYGVFAVIFFLVCGLLVVKRLIPAMQGKTALELNENCIIDYIRNITINWTDVKEIGLVRGRSSSLIRVSLKWVSDYGSEIDIPLRFVKGKDEAIYDEVLEYFAQYSGDIIL
ncbi:hypothetical protein KXD93_11735 [Mucilaginibacter sp. BJC16-A38]|uniref:STM3941 family protein n=1 Tax=Mucilaginibacter phenanthrenivorans TaxID=1234842 RepID=UPI00215790D0|nr:STM3941 family protein [Mucilaginibacter phenanthrenivorans]MCR8558322.1 hypothetical protein [Mucilaginibacter phenanthrenivorans]